MSRRPKLPFPLLEPFLLPFPHPRSPRWKEFLAHPPGIRWAELFGNDRPVEIEVGFGKGMFLVEESQARSDVNFLGIEIERKYAFYAATRLARQKASNVKIIVSDARWLFKECIPENSVQAVHVFFPDPWWKNRHKKRLLFTEEFAEQAARILFPGGLLNFVTDVAEYFEETKQILGQRTELNRLEVPESREGETRVLTNFEAKYREENRPIYQARYEKKDQVRLPLF